MADEKIFNPTALNANEGYISKIQLGDTLYYLTDKEVRTFLQSLRAAAQKNVAAGVTSTEDGLVTGAQVYNAISSLSGAMHFRGVVAKTEGQSDEDALATVTDPQAGDIVIIGTKEYVYGNAKWNELGDEGTHVQITRKVASIALDHDITVAELQTALELGAMAYAATASGTVAGQTISGLKATGTATGTVNTPDITVTPTKAGLSWSASVDDATETLSFEFKTVTAGTFGAIDVVTDATAALDDQIEFTGTNVDFAVGDITVAAKNVTVTPDSPSV